MAIAPFPSPTPAGVVAGACDDLAGLEEVLWSARTGEELVGAVEELQRLRSKVAALEAGILAEVEARQLAKRELAWGSTSDWYAHTAGVTRGAGRRTISHARRLTGERAATLTALRAGEVSPEQAAVILTGLEQLPLTGDVRARGEQVLLQAAGRLNASDLLRTARHLAAVVDPDAADRKAEQDLAREERAAHLGRRLSITEDGAGGIRLRGRGSIEDAAVLKAALLPLTRPQPSPTPDATPAPIPAPRAAAPPVT